MNFTLLTIGVAALVVLVRLAGARLRLSRAKYASLAGHARLARRVAKLVPFYTYGPERFFRADGAPDEVARSRRAGFERLESILPARSPAATAVHGELEHGVSDVQFTDRYRVPFQFRDYVRERLRLPAVVSESAGKRLKDLDGRWSFDLTGSYGMNVFGHELYKDCIATGAARVRDLGPVLGPYHPIVADNVARLKAISGLDEVSFHMSGTEAVMQAVRLARFHTGRSHAVTFAGAYHGWWDGVQGGFGNQRVAADVYCLRDMSSATLAVLRTRKDIACVLVNPLQALHPNRAAPGDATLVDSARAAHFDRAAYAAWLRDLREVCSRRSIVLIFDEVFVGFRLARGGAQEYFGVRADLVTYGKTVGGGLPIGVVCGTHRYMRRFDPERPSSVCFARGTFNAHPYVMGAMNEFLRHLDEPSIAAAYAQQEALWNERTAALNRRLETAALPIRVANLLSIWTVVYEVPSRYNWMLQYYLRAAGLTLSWVGTGRLIFSHDYTDADFAEVSDRFVQAALAMQADGWWWNDGRLTNAAIRRQILREILACRFVGARTAAAAPASEDQPAVVTPRSPSRSSA